MARSYCVYALIVLALLASSVAWAAPDPADGWVQWIDGDGFNNHWYKAFLWTDVPNNPGLAGINWFNAQDYAVSLGGYLATSTSFDENTFIFELANNDAFWVLGEDPSTATHLGPWLGGFQEIQDPEYSEPAGGWRWVTGEAWTYPGWDDGEPNEQIPGESYLHLVGRGENSDKWNDLHGDSEMKGFIVEVEIVPEPSSILALSGGLLGILGIMRKRRA